MLHVVLILQIAETGRLHVAFARLHPFPGGEQPTDCLRWKSEGHHTEGHDSMEEAIAEAKQMQEKLGLPDALVFTKEVIVVDRPVFVVITPNFLVRPVEGNPFAQASLLVSSR